MQKYLLFLLLLILHGCAISTLMVPKGVDRAEVVAFGSTIKHYRIYLERSRLKPILNHKKYLYFYHKRSKQPAVLIHRQKHYTLYSLTDPKQKPFTFSQSYKARYRHILRTLKTQGYQPLAHPERIGFSITVGHRRLNGAKTLRIEAKDYTTLIRLSRHAIKGYTTTPLDAVESALPWYFISDYYTRYAKRATSPQQHEALDAIAQRLQLTPNITPRTPRTPEHNTSQRSIIVEARIRQRIRRLATQHNQTRAKQIARRQHPQRTTTPKTHPKPYRYYLQSASSAELTRYLLNPQSIKQLSSQQYGELMKRQIILRRTARKRPKPTHTPTVGYSKSFLILKAK